MQLHVDEHPFPSRKQGQYFLRQPFLEQLQHKLVLARISKNSDLFLNVSSSWPELRQFVHWHTLGLQFCPFKKQMQ